ncbi:thiamine diphosphokinase [Paenibacillus mendelii]|uniref:Thiamine diphosphokinase n=1 Tax=Paenibacillus mendelii TaxID=206163 RepID=A0ABV6J6H1_9BACL|nr:thiamine diphosphokinase [Paenibacillus mendelii]MCQ6560145.1 thiamine diphosphokinase [Paenibacillus mendelii]
MNTSRILIFTGGQLGGWALDIITNEDFLIGADSGALFLTQNGLRPNVSLGDFDSVSPEQLKAIREASHTTQDFDPIDKNYTDTELAFQVALAMQPKEIVMLGALGTRFDHSLANVHLLRTAYEHGVPMVIMDEHNTIRMTANELVLQRSMFPYVSLLPLTSVVRGITLEGFQYPLHEATLEIGQSLGISNAIVAAQGVVRIREGLLLVIESRD